MLFDLLRFCVLLTFIISGLAYHSNFLGTFLLGSPVFHPVSVVSPLNVAQFSQDLAGHPNQQAVSYVLVGLQHGFRLGICPTRRLQVAKKNKPSAFQNPIVIDNYLANEVSRCSVAGPFPLLPLPNL